MFKSIFMLLCCIFYVGLSSAAERTLKVRVEQISADHQYIDFAVNGRVSKTSFSVISAQTSGVIEDLTVEPGTSF
ncbi:MAG: hypothetical protein ACI8WB_004461, partial [Phenylobacterium sp.]